MNARLTTIAFLTTLIAALGAQNDAVSAPPADADKIPVWRSVAGSGTHFFSTAVIHSVRETPTGRIQRSTDIVELEGDLTGRIVFQPVSRFDFAAGTLVNTGHQVFSGSVLGSAPVLLHDDDFRFEVDLNTGATTGEIILVDRVAGPRVRCLITMNGTGMTPEGDNLFAYQGQCRMAEPDDID